MTSKPRLHTCKTERFKITLPPLAVEEKGIVDEAIWLMRRHFFRSFPDATWDRLRAEITHFSDPSVALANLMDKFGCPYTRFIPNDAMTTRQRTIKGEMGTTGIELGRRWLPPKEIMGNFLHWVGTLTLSTTLKSPDFLMSGAKLLFDTTTPIAVASMVRNGRKSALSAATSATVGSNTMTSFSRLLSVPVCRFLYTACVIFAIVTTTCRVAAAARPMHILSLSDPILEGESAFPSLSRRRDDAHLGGLQRGDIISHVDGERIRSFWSSRAVLQKINDGEVGSTLQVTTRTRRKRRGGVPVPSNGDGKSSGDSSGGGDLDSRTVLVHRHAELISNVKAEVLPSSQGQGVGYLAIDEFSEKTREEVERALQSMRLEIQARAAECRDGGGDGGEGARKDGRDTGAMQGLIIDLRGNPGGPIGSAFDVASMFLGSGTVLSRTCTHREKQSRGFLGRFKKSPGPGEGEGEGDLPLSTGDNKTKQADPNRLKRLLKVAECHSSLNPTPDRRVNLLLLMDEATASASEIMIAALSCHGRALTMGSPTKGKNVAQALVQMSDGSGLAFTIREYLDPRGGYMGDGIAPHIPTAGLGISRGDLVGRIVHRGGDEWSLE